MNVKSSSEASHSDKSHVSYYHDTSVVPLECHSRLQIPSLSTLRLYSCVALTRSKLHKRLCRRSIHRVEGRSSHTHHLQRSDKVWRLLHEFPLFPTLSTPHSEFICNIRIFYKHNNNTIRITSCLQQWNEYVISRYAFKTLSPFRIRPPRRACSRR